MNILKQFLEVSTIHGFYHISSTSKLVRIFWIWVVLTGFIGASLLIYNSFESWRESPVKTTIKTMAIDNLKFPNVTVCPPKNTYTNLNYDLLMTENLTLTNETRTILSSYAFELLHDSFYTGIIANLSLIEDPDRYYNWYHGFTMINIPTWMRSQILLEFPTITTASSGFISTKHYGEKLNVNLVKSPIRIQLDISSPKVARKNQNCTLSIEIEKNSLQELADGQEVYYFSGHGHLKPEGDVLKSNITGPKNSYSFSLYRKVSKLELSSIKLRTMPGFKFKWFYNNNVEPDPEYVQTPVTAEFIKLADFVSKTRDDERENIWKHLRQVRMDYAVQAESGWLPGKCDFYKAFSSDEIIQMNIEKLLNIKEIKDLPKSNDVVNMEKSTLKMAAEMFIFLNFCPNQLFQSPWVKFYRDLIKDNPPKAIILALNRLLKTIPIENKSLYKVPNALLKKLLTLLDLQYENIHSLLNPQANLKNTGNFLTLKKDGKTITI